MMPQPTRSAASRLEALPNPCSGYCHFIGRIEAYEPVCLRIYRYTFVLNAISSLGLLPGRIASLYLVGPGPIRTADLRFRKALLYPAELRDLLGREQNTGRTWDLRVPLSNLRRRRRRRQGSVEGAGGFCLEPRGNLLCSDPPDPKIPSLCGMAFMSRGRHNGLAGLGLLLLALAGCAGAPRIPPGHGGVAGRGGMRPGGGPETVSLSSPGGRRCSRPSSLPWKGPGITSTWNSTSSRTCGSRGEASKICLSKSSIRASR
ncbi:protein of unknown function [Methylacidimicrobium sp. AP8]|nr:protein of unknown function [Methylacidimicrobium sp. AP8]